MMREEKVEVESDVREEEEQTPQCAGENGRHLRPMGIDERRRFREEEGGGESEQRRGEEKNGKSEKERKRYNRKGRHSSTNSDKTHTKKEDTRTQCGKRRKRGESERNRESVMSYMKEAKEEAIYKTKGSAFACTHGTETEPLQKM